MSSEFTFINDPEPLLATLARIFASEGSALEVAILAESSASIQQYDHDWGITHYTLYLQAPTHIYGRITADLNNLQDKMAEKLMKLTTPYPNDSVDRVVISPEIKADSKWREKAKAWIAGDGITNQGRVRSDNIAGKTQDGLLFRSEPEIFLYLALKSIGITFAPLPVFVRGGNSYKRIEPDFVLVKDGIVLVVEVDGDTVHTESPAEAHDRTKMLHLEGVHVERVRASECSTQERANQCAKRILTTIEKIKSSK